MYPMNLTMYVDPRDNAKQVDEPSVRLLLLLLPEPEIIKDM